MRDPTIDDAEIDRLIAVQKPLPDDWERVLKARPRKEFAHKKASLKIDTSAGQFTIVIRENTVNSRDFSVILAISRPNGEFFRLRRYNGLHGGHVNHLERQTITGCHVHKATERYQIAGHREDAYAVASNAFTDVPSALRLMFTDCAFKMPEQKARDDQPQLNLPIVKPKRPFDFSEDE
jgi:hypothetical protein